MRAGVRCEGAVSPSHSGMRDTARRRNPRRASSGREAGGTSLVRSGPSPGVQEHNKKEKKLRKLMILAAMLAVAMIAAAPALAQDDPAVVADAKAKTATAGGAKAEADCTDEMIEAKAGGVVAKAPCKPPPPPPPKAAPPPPPPPKAAPPPPPPAPAPKAEAKKAELPKTGGSGVASLFALGGGALLVGGGLLA